VGITASNSFNCLSSGNTNRRNKSLYNKKLKKITIKTAKKESMGVMYLKYWALMEVIGKVKAMVLNKTPLNLMEAYTVESEYK
jgi:hypothetical protein